MSEIARLSDLADRMMAERADIARLTVELAQAAARQKDLEQIQIPALMEQMGLTELRTASGFKIELEVKPKGDITDEKSEGCYEWLEQNGHGGIIKRLIEVAFNKGQEKDAEALLAEIQPKYAGVRQKKNVHHSTLDAFIRNQLKEGAPLPLDLFSVHFVKQVKVSR